MEATIRRLEGQAMWDAIFPLSQYCFHASPPFPDREEWMAGVRDREGVTCFAAFEEDTPVSTVFSTAMTQNMRGALYPASGVWGVTSHPSARRKGYIRQAMRLLLAAERETGKVFTDLYPFRESFYERLGYVTYPLMKKAHFSTHNLSRLLSLELEGVVDLKMIGEAYGEYREYLAHLLRTRHGMLLFDQGDQAMANRNSTWVAFARVEGNIEGVMLYRLQGEEVTKFSFQVTRFYAETSRARYLLLNWIARHVDQADRVEMRVTPTEYPETWVTDLKVGYEAPSLAGMSRALDVEKIGGMEAGEGSLTARIVDPTCPWNEGNWRFAARGGRLEVSQAPGADCVLTIQGLSALVAGAHDPLDFPMRGWSSAGPALLAEMGRLFPARIPQMHEMF